MFHKLHNAAQFSDLLCMTQDTGGNTGGGQAPTIPPPEMTSVEVSARGNVVGKVSYPLFDEKNPDIGIQQIATFDWSKAYEDGGYTSWKDAVVKLVNTQYGTNVRNKFRQANDPEAKVPQSQIQTLAQARITMEEFQGAVGDPAKFAALMDKKINEVKAEMEAQKQQRLAAAKAHAASTTPTNGANAQEQADAQAAQDAVVQGVPA